MFLLIFLCFFCFFSQIFLIDYGTTHIVQLANIFEWTSLCDKFPFQAAIFTIVNVNEANESHKNVQVATTFQNNFVLAEVKYESNNMISLITS